MARLIIGHTTDRSVKIWVRGEPEYPFVFLTLTGPETRRYEQLTVLERHYFTGIFRLDGLKAETDYEVSITYARTPDALPEERVDCGHCQGRFRTFPEAGSDSPLAFLFGSCNFHAQGAIAGGEKAYTTLSTEAATRHANFMLHCGDQIYYDWNLINRVKTPRVYRYIRTYLDSWHDCRAMRHYLTELPHYMILDDHEIVDNFSNERKFGAGFDPEKFRDVAMKAYEAFEHSHNPDTPAGQRYYQFSYGAVEFFVLDVRTERYPSRGQIISERQMQDLLDWLLRHKDKVKFVVTSVCLVAEFTGTEADDKWCAPAFRGQREQVLEHLLRHDIQGTVILTGDQHCTYHASMDITRGEQVLRLHELMASPINQLAMGNAGDYDAWESFQSQDGSFSYRSIIHQFYNQHSNAMAVSVNGRLVSYQSFTTKTNPGSVVFDGQFEI